MTTPDRDSVERRLVIHRFMVSLKAAIPLIVFQALFLLDPVEASIGLSFAYHAMPALGPLLLMLMWLSCCYFEWQNRAAKREVHTFPSFSVAGSLLLAGFYFSAQFVNPIVGGIVWMTVVIGIFQLIGKYTIGRVQPQQPDE